MKANVESNAGSVKSAVDGARGILASNSLTEG
jgi:hypothetical protein